jgi:hypothetical protein
VLAACGGGSSNKAASTSSSSPGNTATASSASSGTANVGDLATNCAAASAALSAGGNFSSGGSLKDQATKARDSFRALQSAVSDGATKDALKVMADSWNDFANTVGDTNYDPSKGQAPPAAVIAALQIFGKPEYLQATTTIANFFGSGCKS